MKFVDETVIYVTAGNGGSGIASFRREKHVPRGGPDGGDGGHGGNVVIKASRNKNTLLGLRLNQKFKAEDGQSGMSQKKNGRNGKPYLIEVPCGTILYDEATNEQIGEVVDHNQELVIARGGKRGLGNARFTSSVNQAPRQFTTGTEGEEKKVRLELKLLADVGLVGLPNAGKSTFLSSVSKANPKIADYPFTTLSPVLGVIQTSDYDSFTIADIPGIIENASQGSGLGIEFLKHIERTSILLHLVDISLYPHEDPLKNFNLIQNELSSYHPDLVKKPIFIVFTKIDSITPEIKEEVLKEFKDISLPYFFISSVSREGVDTLQHEIYEVIQKQRLEQVFQD